jgi:transposase, IS5 family
MGQRGFWDEKKRNHMLQQKKPTLAILSEAIPWETFRPLLEQGYNHERKSNAGRKRIDPLLLFKILVLQQLFNLNDEELEIQVNDGRSFEEFVGLGVMNTIPDATTIAFFRERLRKAGVIDELVNGLRSTCAPRDWRPVAGRSSMPHWISVPKQRNSRPENEAIKRGQLPEGWADKPERFRQKDLDAHWIKKTGISHSEFKNSICIDAEHRFICRYAITPANIHDSQMIPQLLDPENRNDFVWADSDHSGARSEDLLEAAGFEGRIHEKGSRCHPLSEEIKERNKVRSTVRLRTDHVFGAITTGMSGKLTRRIGLVRMKAWWGLRNLTYNLLHYMHYSSRSLLAA